MKIKVLTTCDNLKNPGYLRLKESLERHGWDYHCIQHPFSFGKQMLVIKDWVNAYDGDATHILYTDAFDTIAFAGPDEVIGKVAVEKFEVGYIQPQMLISCEKACFPHPERAKDYPETKTPWKYVNGGGWIASLDFLKTLFVRGDLNSDSHDQIWLMDVALKFNIPLDNNCDIFQTIAFSHPEEWERHEDRWKNIGTGTLPVFFHGNGRTEMNWLTA